MYRLLGPDPDLEDLKKKVAALEKRWHDISVAAISLESLIRPAYTEVISNRRATKDTHVFELGVAVDEFLKEWFG